MDKYVRMLEFTRHFGSSRSGYNEKVVLTLVFYPYKKTMN